MGHERPQATAWPGTSPDRVRGPTEGVVAGQLLAGHTALDAPLHPGAEITRLDELHELLRHVAEVEEAALPLDQQPLVEPEPAPPDPVDLVAGAVALVDDLLPEADDLVLLLVDDHLLVLVDPVLQSLHLQPQGGVADLRLADAHHVFLGPDVPDVGGVVGVEVGKRRPVPGLLGVPVGLKPPPDPVVELLT